MQNLRLDNQQFETIGIDVDPDNQSVWIRFLHPGRPVMTKQLLQEFNRAQDMIGNTNRQARLFQTSQQLRYQILSSALPGVFNLGGDLAYFLDLIAGQDKQKLSEYARACTDILVNNLHGRGQDLCTIALVEGEALGGGFESALAADVLVAEKQARFGFPETQFGLFPGMGAFSFLARKLNPAMARRIITSGKVYTAEELYEMGAVDVLVEDGHGEEMVHHYIRRRQQREGGFSALDTIMAQHNPISSGELETIVDLWVDTALDLNQNNLGVMRYFLKAQTRRWGEQQQDVIQKVA